MRKNKSLFSFIVFVMTLAFLDRLLELILKPFLHRKRDKFIQRAIDDFRSISTNENVMLRLTENLNEEADRIYAIVDRSILRERIIRAKYTFFATALAATILVGSLGGFTSGTVVPFITPVSMAGVAWLTSILTIAVSYHQRVKGAMDSVIVRQASNITKLSHSSNELIKQGLAANDPEMKEVISQLQTHVPILTPAPNLIQLDTALDQMEEGRARHQDITEAAPAAVMLRR